MLARLIRRMRMHLIDGKNIITRDSNRQAMWYGQVNVWHIGDWANARCCAMWTRATRRVHNVKFSNGIAFTNDRREAGGCLRANATHQLKATVDACIWRMYACLWKASASVFWRSINSPTSRFGSDSRKTLAFSPRRRRPHFTRSHRVFRVQYQNRRNIRISFGLTSLWAHTNRVWSHDQASRPLYAKSHAFGMRSTTHCRHRSRIQIRTRDDKIQRVALEQSI